MPSRRRSSATPRYTPLPRSSSDSFSRDSPSSSRSNSNSEEEEFKDKPLPLLPRRRRASLLLRKCRRCCRPLYVGMFLFVLLAWQIIFNGSYSDGSAPKYEINKEEKVFIAANIIDGDLIRGAWGRSLLELVERIGKDRVYVSIYGGPPDALKDLEQMLECETRIVSEESDPINLQSVARTQLPTGESRIKRITFLAEVRNKVLEPLRDGSAWKSMGGKGVVDKIGLGKKGGFEKVLFINDVFFDAEGATRLLWGTNLDKDGKAGGYKAVCAADFVTSWKYYDTFATRDAEGYSIGIPLFPWFSAEGDAISRNDVLAGRDAVRVKSCWGGMVAFDGWYFQPGNPLESESISASQHKESTNASGKGKGKKVDGVGIPELPLRFRSEAEPFWDSSECCLIHADIMSLPTTESEVDTYDTGIYMNPYVRTAYSSSAFAYIGTAKRFERVFSPLQRILNYFASMPRFNYRRAEKEGQIVHDKLWISVHSNMTEQQSIEAANNHDTGLGDEDNTWQSGGIEKRATLGHQKEKSTGQMKGIT
ncbi:uncharacterized protein PAC_16767 [Phialocephala subalpina]|uniref:Polysaccharide export protein (CAP59) n=1 Tax=Phialocephala subalpina TaxID=576137 RepID=A0A1L7XPK5_9HELO|nr:uncharacterized protein PAC_16767 [Phialocephala subalpina]